MTPHIEAKKEEISKTVLMPGDPLRAKFIADNFLENAVLVNSVRNIFAYTGYYKDKKITVMASGMGNPSMGIYSYELYKFYDVENIIRIGTAGAYIDKLNLKDIILVQNSYSNSTYAQLQNGSNNSVISSSEKLNNIIKNTAIKMNLPISFDTIYCSDVFYSNIENFKDLYTIHNCVGVEMESFALFHNANVLNKNAACILSVSDSFVKTDKLSSEERKSSLNSMITLALESAINVI